MTLATIHTGKRLAAAFCKGRTHLIRLYDEGALETRLEGIRDWCERATRRDIYGDDALPRGYNAAAYGLWWVVASGRVNGETAMALRAMSTRQLCELVHTLLFECGSTTEWYAQFLMERYTVAA